MGLDKSSSLWFQRKSWWVTCVGCVPCDGRGAVAPGSWLDTNSMVFLEGRLWMCLRCSAPLPCDGFWLLSKDVTPQEEAEWWREKRKWRVQGGHENKWLWKLVVRETEQEGAERKVWMPFLCILICVFIHSATYSVNCSWDKRRNWIQKACLWIRVHIKKTNNSKNPAWGLLFFCLLFESLPVFLLLLHLIPAIPLPNTLH